MNLTIVLAVVALFFALLIWRAICAIERASVALERVGDVLAYALEHDDDWDE